MSTRARASGEGSIFPYRNGFAAYVWVTQPNGQRQRKYVYGKTREQVHEKWLKLQQQARQGPMATSVPKLGEFLSYWLEEVVKPNLAPATHVNYELFVRRYITPGLGTKRLDRLSVRDIQTWINEVARTCQCCAQGKDTRRPAKKRRCCAVGKCCQAQLSPRTVSDIRACLRAALSQAVTEDLIVKNPAKTIKLPAVRKRKGKVWSSEEARQFLESARSERDPLYAVYVLILVLGLRKGEALGLTWDDIDLESGELSIGLQLQRVRRRLLHRETKTSASDATLPLPDICVTALKLRKTEEANAKAKAGSAWQGSELIFTTKWGTPIEPRNFNRSWDARCAKAGIRKITVHDGRRTCATLLVDLDVHPRQVMQILRHAQIAVTMEIYAQASSKATRSALKRLGDSLGG
ncbi:MAG TPA: site-specific integrase [Pseudonocardiaceae bacterium]|nr:site-specific integrase [Pseudonocardiaceae bacterium]